MATVKTRKKKAAAVARPTYQSGTAAAVALVLGILLCLAGAMLMWAANRNGMVYLRPLQWGIISVVLGVFGFIIALKLKPKA